MNITTQLNNYWVTSCHRHCCTGSGKNATHESELGEKYFQNTYWPNMSLSPCLCNYNLKIRHKWVIQFGCCWLDWQRLQKRNRNNYVTVVHYFSSKLTLFLFCLESSFIRWELRCPWERVARDFLSHFFLFSNDTFLWNWE